MRFLIFCILFLAAKVDAATIVCDSCSHTDVTNGVFAAVNGDTVVIPAGTCDWSLAVMLTNKAIRLTGAGVGSTIIRDTASTAAPWIRIWLQPPRITEIDNIEFRFVSGFPSDRIWIEGINTDNRNINWHHCKFLGSGASSDPTIFYTETARGVIHHNIFDGNGSATLIVHCKDSFYDGVFQQRDYGNASLASADFFGSTNFIFFEDNLITNYTSVGTDGQAGGRYVWRNNTNYNMNVQTHGSEAAERSGRAFEVYSNYFLNPPAVGNTIAAYWRGGIVQMHGNVYSNWPSFTTFNLLDNRIREHLFPSYGGASGENPWDTNDATGVFDSGTIDNTGGPLNNTVTDFDKNWTTDQFKHYQILRTSGKTVTSLTYAGGFGTATVTAHGFTNNTWVSFWGADHYGWNQIFQPVTSNDANTITFPTPNVLPTPATGTILCCQGNNFARILSNTATNITFDNSVYQAIASASMRMTNGDTYAIRRVVACMDQVGLWGGTNFGTTSLPDLLPQMAHHQTVSCCYQWGNVFLDSPTIEWVRSAGGGLEFSHIIPGKHYSNNVAKPGYTPFPYPHYIADGSSPPEPPVQSDQIAGQGINGIIIK